MRFKSLIGAALVTVSLVSLGSATNPPGLPTPPASLAATQVASVDALAAMLARNGFKAVGSHIVPVQFGCQAPGQQTCLNGWVWVCQCFSYGCNYMATAYRC
jgi:hypothetical protein